MKKLLIFDLDHTIFDTKSIKKESVQSILKKFQNIAIKKYGEALTNKIIDEFWEYPFDYLAHQYNFDEHLKFQLSNAINHTNFVFDIKPFKDFEIIKDFEATKILVTTGFKKLQESKIKQLGILSVFDEIYIDDILDPNRIFKKGIFAKILAQREFEPKDIYIVGDNPVSELKAGYELGLTTIQVSKLGQEKSEYANHIISNYHELLDLIA